MRIRGNVILVTGGGSGIGRGLAEQLHQRDNEIIITGRREKQLKETVDANPGMRYLVADLDDPDAIRDLRQNVLKIAPRLNVLINNAGMQRPEDLRLGDASTAESTLMTNLLGPIRLTAAFLPQLLDQPDSVILNVTSALAFHPMSSIPSYCASKAALHSYTQSLRSQLQGSSVAVIEIIPPWVQTALQGAEGFHPAAMPLPQYVEQTMRRLESQPDATEIRAHL